MENLQSFNFSSGSSLSEFLVHLVSCINISFSAVVSSSLMTEPYTAASSRCSHLFSADSSSFHFCVSLLHRLLNAAEYGVVSERCA